MSAGDDPNDLHRRLVARFPEQTGDYVLIGLDPRGSVVGINEAGVRILGYAGDELVGQPLTRIFTEDDIALGLDRHELVVAGGQGFSEDDRWHRRKDGTRIWASGILAAIRGDGGTPLGFVKVMRDRTDQCMLIDALHNRLAEETRRGRERMALMGTLGHELRNPVHTLGGALAVLRKILADDARTSRPLEIAERQLNAFSRLVGDLRDAVGAEVGALQLQIERIELQAAILGAIEARRDAAEERGLTIRALLPDTSISLDADPLRFEQIVGNLIDNAIKYTRPSGHVWVTATVEDVNAVIRIRDDGDGIPPETLPRIFEMFTRDSTAVASADGLGIGLAVVRNLVRLHDGAVEVRLGGEGWGSEFTVVLPLESRHRLGSTAGTAAPDGL